MRSSGEAEAVGDEVEEGVEVVVEGVGVGAVLGDVEVADEVADVGLGVGEEEGVNAMSSSSSATSFVGRPEGLESICRSKNFPDVPVP